MTTIPDTMKTISRDIQNTFEELVKILLRKTLRPALNPLNANTKIVYNTFRGRYERGFIGSLPDDHINKYSYVMTHESLGWDDEILANFKVMAKFIKNNVPQRFPAGNTKTHNLIKPKTKIAFSDKEIKAHEPSQSSQSSQSSQYKNFLDIISSRSMHSVIANKKATFSYTTDIPYTYAFKQLESIGKDIIDQTDPCITGEDSAKMSTAMLRVKLYNLEQNLAQLSVDHPNIFDAYVEMLRLVNSVPRTKIMWIINLIALLSYQRWEQVSPSQQQSYVDILGETFMETFNSNELITILLQSGSSEIILTSVYLYPLMKMLFIVFGYSKLVPFVTDKCGENTQEMCRERMRKHLEKYRGASFRRGDGSSRIIPNRYRNCDPCSSESASDSCSSIRTCEGYYPLKYQDNRVSKQDSDCQNNCQNNCQDNCQDNCTDNYVNSYPNIHEPEPCKSCPEPIDQCVYEFIKLFGDLYPTVIGLMGGTEEFPPECIEIKCSDIPPNYDHLTTLPEYFWRFNDYSYCRYLEFVSSKQLTNALYSKINAKVKYLHSI